MKEVFLVKKISIGNGEISASEISLGCMRMANLSNKEASFLINTALEEGINFFDHADIYGGGKSEEIFAKAIDMNASIREKLILQTKCGIREGYFDFSKEHILESVDGSLKRLQTDYVDVLLLHRPDTLMEPEEVAEAFDVLYSSGKVKSFGVSNQNPMQIELLKKYVNQRIAINQLQLSITNTGMIDSGINVNMKVDNGIDRDGSILEYCRLNDITIQAWSPFQFGFFEGVFLDNDKFPELNKKIDEIAEIKGVSNTAIAIAWILRHPAKIQPIVGTTNSNRLRDICKASDVTLTRQEWYEIYRSAGNKLP
jgi:predicted oxidoreductase